MKPSTRLLPFFLLLAALTVLIAGCGTFFNVRMNSPTVWLEGKDYTVQFSMANAEKAKKITLYYRVNNLPIKVVEPRLNGSLREYLIPAAEILPGTLEYYVVVTDADGKEHKEEAARVLVASRAEGKAAAERDLARRVQVTLPAEIGINADFDLTLRILGQKSQAEVTIFVKDTASTRYRSAALSSSAGEFRYRIVARDLKEGALNYYFKVAETDPDFGRIEGTYPSDADSKPLVTNVLGLNEMASRMESELARSVIHQPPAEALVTADLKISLVLRVPAQGLLASLLLEPPSVLLHAGKKETNTRFRSLPMTPDGKGGYSAFIDRRSLEAGVNCYFFTISAQTRDVGNIDARIPEGGEIAPFVFRLVSLEEMRERRLREIERKLVHTPPEKATQIDALTLQTEYPRPVPGRDHDPLARRVLRDHRSGRSTGQTSHLLLHRRIVLPGRRRPLHRRSRRRRGRTVHRAR
jgi:hypothetical protein